MLDIDHQHERRKKKLNLEQFYRQNLAPAPVSLRVLFRPHYVTWSERQMIEFHAPDHLRNVVRIITETGLRVYKELVTMK